MASGSLNTLAGVSSADTLFDVQVIWDPTTKRFYYTMIDSISQTNNDLAFGFSKSSSPSSGSSSDWCKYSIDFGSQFPDYPKLGDSKYFALIGVNVFTAARIFLGAEALGDEEAGVGSGCPSSLEGHEQVTPHEQRLDPGLHTRSRQRDRHQAERLDRRHPEPPAEQEDLAVQGQEENGKAKIQGTATQLKVEPVRRPPNAPQSGNSVRIDTLDGRLTQAVAATDTGHNDKFALWTQHTVSGGAGSKVRWYEIYPSDPKLIQNGLGLQQLEVRLRRRDLAEPRRQRLRQVGRQEHGLELRRPRRGRASRRIKMVSKKGGNSQSGQVAVKQSPGPIAGFDCSDSGGGGEPDGTSSQLCRWGDYASATPDPSNSPRIWNVSQWASGNKPGLHDGSQLPRDLEDADLRRQPLAGGRARPIPTLLMVAGWSPHGRGASWALVVDSRECKYPPVVEISWG